MIGKQNLYYRIIKKLAEGGMSQNHPQILRDERYVILLSTAGLEALNDR